MMPQRMFAFGSGPGRSGSGPGSGRYTSAAVNRCRRKQARIEHKKRNDPFLFSRRYTVERAEVVHAVSDFSVISGRSMHAMHA